MKSRTSFCKLLLKDITRFFPLWLGYCFVLLLIILAFPEYLTDSQAAQPGMIYYHRYHYSFQCIHILSLPYAVCCAVMLFTDLYNRQRALFIDALPVKKATWFFVHTLSGLLFYLIPTGICLLLLKADAGIMAGMVLHFLLCYGLALLGAMLAGNRISAVLTCCSLYFLPTVALALYSSFYRPYLPSIYLMDSELSYTSYTLQGLLFFRTPLNLYGKDLGYFLTLGCLGILMGVAALVLHRFRKPEQTGSFSVFSGLRYPFAVIFSFVASMALFPLLRLQREQFYFLFLFVPVLYFAAAMLGEKRFHVFRRGHILTLCIFAAVLFNSFWIVRCDAFGILDYVPNPKHVRSVEVYVEDSDIIGIDTYYYDESLFSQAGCRVVAYEDIAKVTEVHNRLLRHRDFSGESCMVYLTYTLKSGIRVRRYYPCPRPLENDAFDTLNQAVSTRASVFGMDDWEDYVNQVYHIEVSTARGGNRTYWFGTPETTAAAQPGTVKIHRRDMLEAFLNALKRSCDDGCLQQLSSDDYTVKVYSRDLRGREQVLTFSIPCLANSAAPLLTIFWDTARQLPDKTITDDTCLESYDVVFNADGTFIKVPRPDLLP